MVTARCRSFLSFVRDASSCCTDICSYLGWRLCVVRETNRFFLSSSSWDMYEWDLFWDLFRSLEKVDSERQSST
jgi:hypothetical protein